MLITYFKVIQTRTYIFHVSTLPKSICDKTTAKNRWSLPELVFWTSKQLFPIHFLLATRIVGSITGRYSGKEPRRCTYTELEKAAEIEPTTRVVCLLTIPEFFARNTGIRLLTIHSLIATFG